MYKLLSEPLWQEVFQKTYGLKGVTVPVEQEKEMLFSVLRYPLTGFKKMISLPYISYYDTENISNNDHLERKILKSANSEGIRKIEIRFSRDLSLNWQTNLQYVTFIIDLQDGADSVFSKCRNSVRTSVRKGEKSGLKAFISKDLLDSFFDIYSISVKRLGTPVHSYRFFKELISHEAFNILTVLTEEGVPVSSVLFGYDADTIYPLWGGGLSEYAHLSHDSFKYWELIKYAIAHNLKYFNFGRSMKNTGTYDFKKRWAAEERQLYYYYYDMKKPGDISVASDIQKSKAGRKFANFWSKLPLSVTRKIGPCLRKYFP